MANEYRPATEEELELLRRNGFVLDSIKVKHVDDQKFVAEIHNTGHEIWIIRGNCRQWL